MIARITQLEPAPPWSLLGAVNTVFVGLITMIAGSLIALTLIGDQPYYLLVAWILGLVLTTVYVYISRRQPADREALRLGQTNSRLLIVFLFSVGTAILIDFIGLGVTGQFLPVPELSALYGTSPGIISWILAAIFMLAAQPVAEELVFRGVFYASARHLLSAWGGLIACAMVYGLFHYIAYSGPTTLVWYALFAPLLSGLVITGVRANSGSTRAAIVAHIGFSVFALLKFLMLPA